MDSAKHDGGYSGHHWRMGRVWGKGTNAVWINYGGVERRYWRANHWCKQWLAEGIIIKKKDATILYATAVYSNLSRFETPIEVFLGHLRWDRGGV
jgi:hypothetical protein